MESTGADAWHWRPSMYWVRDLAGWLAVLSGWVEMFLVGVLPQGWCFDCSPVASPRKGPLKATLCVMDGLTPAPPPRLLLCRC